MKDKLRKIVREIMKEKVISELDEAQSPAQKAAFEKMLAKKDGKDESTDDEKEEVKESVSEAAPKMKKSAESEKLQKVYRAAELSQKGGSPSRYSREFESAKKKALKYIGDMITYTKIGK